MEHVTFSIDGSPLEVVSLRGDEAVSALFHYELRCACADRCPSPDDLLGLPAAIELSDAFGGQRTVRGIVAEATTEVSGAQWAGGPTAPSGDVEPSLSVVVRPAAFRLTLGRDSRAFHDASAVDIVKSVLARGDVPARWQTGGTYAPRIYTAQYREDDWAFIARLLVDEGIYFWFDHDEGGSILVFGDSSGSAPDLHGGARVRFVFGAMMRTEVEVVHELGPAAIATPGQFRLRGFDPARPASRVESESRSVSARGGALGVYDAPMGGPEDPGVLARRAAILEQQAAARRHACTGRSSSARLSPGRTLEIVDSPAPQWDGRLFITACAVEVVQRRRGATTGGSPDLGGAERSFDVRFRAVPAGSPFRPGATASAAAMARAPTRTGAHGAVGLQSGVVVGPASAEVHPDDAGRVRVQYHWDREGRRDERAGKWMRVAQRCTAGSMLLPRTGWNVMALHEEGSADAPMVQNRVVDAEHPPPYNLPRDKTRTVYKTATVPGGGSFNEIRYESRAGAEEMLLVASHDFTVLANNTKTEAVTSNALHSVARDHALTVKGTALESVAGSQATSIGGDEKETVSGARDVKVTAREAKKIAGGRRLGVKGASEASVVGGRDVSVGAAQIDVSLGSVKAVAPTIKILVGGALIKVTPRGITETIGTTVTLGGLAGAVGGAAAGMVAGLAPAALAGVGASVQAIGAAKLELAGVSRAVVAGKTIRETVGGAMVLLTKDFVDRASESSSLTIGGELTVQAPAVLVEANESIAIRCGSAKIVISKAGVTITAPNVDLSKATALVAEGALIEQN